MHKSMEELRKKLEKALEELVKKPDLSAGTLDAIHKVTDTLKNLDKIEMLESEGGYSQGGDWMGGYENRNSYEGGNSGAGRRGSTYVHGYYRRGNSRDGGNSYAGGSSYGNSYGGNSMRGYSRDDGKEMLKEQFEEMLETTDDPKTKEAIMRCMREIEQ